MALCRCKYCRIGGVVPGCGVGRTRDRRGNQSVEGDLISALRLGPRGINCMGNFLEGNMQRFALACAVMLTVAAPLASAQQGAGGQYRVVKTVKAGGEGGFDYVYADVDARRLYITRRGPGARITVWDLDTLAPAGEVPNADAHGVVVDEKSGHAFASSRPLLMFDPKTLQPIKRIDVQGDPDTLFLDPDNQRVYVMSRRAPNVTAIDAKDGTVLGNIDIGGAAEEMGNDGRSRLYVVVQNKHNVAVIDAKIGR